MDLFDSPNETFAVMKNQGSDFRFRAAHETKNAGIDTGRVRTRRAKT
jgi:hypothetical protein